MSQFHRFQVGELRCTVLNDGGREMPIKRFFPTVDAAELEQALRDCGFSAELNGGLDAMMTPMAFDVLHIDTGTDQILIDTGYGQTELLASIAAADLDPAEVSAVLITHGDGDHIGGIDQFPNARFKMPRLAWNLWGNEAGLQRMVTEFTDVFGKLMSVEEVAQAAAGRMKYGQKILPALAERVDLYEPEIDVLPGIRFVSAPGHRSDHMAVEIRSAGETILHIVDAFRHAVQAARPDWHSFVDSYPDQTVSTIKQLMTRAAENDALVFGTHFPFPGLGQIEKDGAAFRWRTISSR